jgi:hypothetical protein
MTLLQPVGVPSDMCLCGHYSDDHQPECTVIDDGFECRCPCFVPDDKEEGDDGYLFTADDREDGGLSLV